MSTTKTTDQMKKIVLNFDKTGFEFAQAMFNEKNALIDAIKLTAKNELDLTIEVTDSISLKENIYKAVETKYKKQNTLNLTGEKLIELMQIDLDPIYNTARLLESYNITDEKKEPTKEMFTISVDNDKEMERYNHALKVIDIIKESQILTNDNRQIGVFVLPFGNIIKYNLEFNDLEPLPLFVKGNYNSLN